MWLTASERVQDHHGKELDSEQTDVVLEKWLREDLSASRRQREQETERQRQERQRETKIDSGF